MTEGLIDLDWWPLKSSICSIPGPVLRLNASQPRHQLLILIHYLFCCSHVDCIHQSAFKHWRYGSLYTLCYVYVYRHCKLCFQNVFLSTICLLGYYMNIYNECGNCAMNSVTGDTIFLTEVYIWSWFPSSCIFELCDDINVQILTLSWCHLSLRWTSHWIKKESSISISIIMF